MKKFFFTICVASFFCSCVSESKYNSDISYLEDKISRLERDMGDLEYRNSILEEEKEELEEQVERLEDIIERAKRRCIIWDDDASMAWSVLNEY